MGMTEITAKEARQKFSDVINRAEYGGERVAITRRGKRIVYVVPVRDVELLEELETRVDLDEARKALKEIETEGTVSWEKVKAELAI